MSIFVLYDKAGLHSGRVLGQHLIKRLSGVTAVLRGRPERLTALQKQGQNFDYIVNVGWFRPFDPKNAVVLNAPEAIALSSNKRAARIKFNSKGVPAPKLWMSAESLATMDLPVIARTTHHTKGHGLWFCQTLEETKQAQWEGATHYLKFIPNIREFRAHVMAPSPELGKVPEEDYRVIKVSEKLPRGEASRQDVVKNHDNGWFFGYPADKKDPVLPRVRSISKKVIKLFGLHWGAVDIMLSKDTGDLFVLEINSTPCLTDYRANTLEKYTDALCILVGQAPLPARKKREPTQKEAAKPASKLRALLARMKV